MSRLRSATTADPFDPSFSVRPDGTLLQPPFCTIWRYCSIACEVASNVACESTGVGEARVVFVALRPLGLIAERILILISVRRLGAGKDRGRAGDHEGAHRRALQKGSSCHNKSPKGRRDGTGGKGPHDRASARVMVYATFT